MEYKILLSKTALSQLNALDSKLQTRIKDAIRLLKENPFLARPGADIKKLKSLDDPKLYRLRIGDYRIIYFIINDEIKITEIFHRKKGYKWLN